MNREAFHEAVSGFLQLGYGHVNQETVENLVNLHFNAIDHEQLQNALQNVHDQAEQVPNEVFGMQLEGLRQENEADRKSLQALNHFKSAGNILLAIYRESWLDPSALIRQIVSSFIEKPLFKIVHVVRNPRLGPGHAFPRLDECLQFMFQNPAQDENLARGICDEDLSIAMIYAIYASGRKDMRLAPGNTKKLKEQAFQIVASHNSGINQGNSLIESVGSKAFRLCYCLARNSPIGIFILHWLQITSTGLKDLHAGALAAITSCCLDRGDILATSDILEHHLTPKNRMTIQIMHFTGQVVVPALVRLFTAILSDNQCRLQLPEGLTRFTRINDNQLVVQFGNMVLENPTEDLVDTRYKRNDVSTERMLHIGHGQWFQSFNRNWFVRQLPVRNPCLFFSYLTLHLQLQQEWANLEANRLRIEQHILPGYQGVGINDFPARNNLQGDHRDILMLISRLVRIQGWIPQNQVVMDRVCIFAVMSLEYFALDQTNLSEICHRFFARPNLITSLQHLSVNVDHYLNLPPISNFDAILGRVSRRDFRQLTPLDLQALREPM